MAGRVLIIEDDESLRDLLAEVLPRRGFTVETVATAAAGLEAVRVGDPDVVVTDLHLAGMDGIELCARLAEQRPHLPVVVITAFGSMDTAVAALRAGAWDFVTKPFEMDLLVAALERAVQHRALHEEVKRLRRAALPEAFEELLGGSPAMRSLYGLLDRIADTESSVLITGESGTGKELVARALHRRSRRRNGPFVAGNCAALPESLLESELFGHVKGAFTDARGARRGLFPSANGGTLFLDEIGDLPLSFQPKLLRALQEWSVRPVGSDAEVPFDARLVCATNTDLDGAVVEGRFREDLLYRIDVIRVEVPPLRARGNDVLLLAQHFLERFAARAGKRVVGLSGTAASKLLDYRWPGNVRELQNCMERAVALTAYDQITVEDLPERVRDFKPSHVIVAAEDPSELVPMEVVERRYLRRVLEAVGGNKTLAAKVLGFDRTTLYRKLERYGIEGD